MIVAENFFTGAMNQTTASGWGDLTHEDLLRPDEKGAKAALLPGQGVIDFG